MIVSLLLLPAPVEILRNNVVSTFYCMRVETNNEMSMFFYPYQHHQWNSYAIFVVATAYCMRVDLFLPAPPVELLRNNVVATAYCIMRVEMITAIFFYSYHHQ